MQVKKVAGFEFSFERRRYGSTTYTWVYLNRGADRVSLGDPWPCVTPKRSELIAAAIVADAKEVA